MRNLRKVDQEFIRNNPKEILQNKQVIKTSKKNIRISGGIENRFRRQFEGTFKKVIKSQKQWLAILCTRPLGCFKIANKIAHEMDILQISVKYPQNIHTE